MKTKSFALNLTLICCLIFLGQAWTPLAAKSAKHLSASGAGVNIDVVYHRAEWRINPDSSVKAISGSVTTYFKTTVANVATITFDLRQSAFNNTNLKVKFRGAMLPSTSRTISNSNILSITLGATLPLGMLDSITIYYGGTPPAVSGAAEGFQLATNSSGDKYIYTLSESYEDRDWWPCKADMQDKIDSMDIIVSTPWVGADTFWVATNGVLTDSTISGNSRQFTFKNRYPMASYLVCLSVARYKRYYTSVNVSGTDVPVAYYLFRGKTTTTYNNILTAMNKINEALVVFSEKFGDYPFKKEKHGFYEGLGGAGGMEHQTFSAIATSALTSISTLTHELMHQWFGDKVTFATWEHLWLAEGFARYSESLVAELVSGTGLNAVTKRNDCKVRTFNNYANTSLIIPTANAANSDEIWGGSYGGAVYDKGAVVVSMLRKLAGDDRFYLACKNYMNDPALAYRAATTDDLKNHFEAVLNYDLDAFFDDYTSVTGKGYPAYDISWGNSGTGVNIELTTQRRSNTTGVTYFRTPVVIKISNATKDTTVVIYDQNGQLSYAGNGISTARTGKVLGYNLSFVPTTVTVDPNSETLVRGQDGTVTSSGVAGQSTVTKVSRLNVAPTIVQVLPISIIDFKGNHTHNSNHLSLLFTATHEDIKILLERSENGVSFSTLGEMDKSTIGSTNLHYTYSDRDLYAASNYYYRAKTIDEKGVVKYSKVILLSGNKTEASFRVMPNPANDHLFVSIPENSSNESWVLTVHNSAGGVILKKKVSGINSPIRIDLKQLPSGSYTLTINGAQEKQWVHSFAIVR